MLFLLNIQRAYRALEVDEDVRGPIAAYIFVGGCALGGLRSMSGVLLDFPSRRAVLEIAAAAYAKVRQSGHGQLLLVSGANGSGRSRLLHALAARLVKDDRTLRVTVYDRSTGSARVESWSAEVAHNLHKAGTVLSAAGQTISLAGPPGSVAAGPVGGAGGAAEGLAKIIDLTEARRQPEVATAEQAVAAMRASAKPGQPGVWLIDDLDEKDADLWWDLVAELPYQLDDRPLLLVCTFCCPFAPTEDRNDLPGSAGWARRLEKRGHAKWIHLPPLSAEDIAEFLRPADTAVTNLLWQVSEGNARTAVLMWDEWRRKHWVHNPHGPWQLRTDAAAVADSVGIRLRQRLAEALGGNHELADEIRRWLGVAALEGSVFTANVVAAALDLNRDTVIDGFDAVEAGAGKSSPVRKLDFVNPTRAGRPLCRYQFGRQLDLVYLQRRGLPDQAARPDLSRRYAEALISLYGELADELASTLARLYRDAGQKEQAAFWQRRQDRKASVAAMVALASRLLAADTSHWLAADFHWAADWLAEAARRLYGSASNDLVLKMHEKAYLWAKHSGDKHLAAHCCAGLGIMLGNVGDSRALPLLEAAYTETENMLDDRAEAAKSLAVWVKVRDPARAMSLLGEAAELARQTGNKVTEAQSLNNLAQLTIDPEEGLTALQRALQLDAADRSHPPEQIRTRLLQSRAEKQLELGRLDEALASATKARAEACKVDDAEAEAFALFSLGRIQDAQGQASSSVRDLAATLAITSRIKDDYFQRAVLLLISLIAESHDEPDTALTFALMAADAALAHGGDPTTERVRASQLAVAIGVDMAALVGRQDKAAQERRRDGGASAAEVLADTLRDSSDTRPKRAASSTAWGSAVGRSATRTDPRLSSSSVAARQPPGAAVPGFDDVIEMLLQAVGDPEHAAEHRDILVHQGALALAAEAGDPDAMYNLGVLFNDSDPAQARQWYERAALAGDRDAMYNLGQLLYDSDPAQARKWWQQAAQAGHTDAMFNLGMLLRDSDPAQARKWWERAAQTGDPDAMYNLGVLLKDSDPAQARKWHKQARRARDAKARLSRTNHRLFQLDAHDHRYSDPRSGDRGA